MSLIPAAEIIHDHLLDVFLRDFEGSQVVHDALPPSALGVGPFVSTCPKPRISPLQRDVVYVFIRPPYFSIGGVFQGRGMYSRHWFHGKGVTPVGRLITLCLMNLGLDPLKPLSELPLLHTGFVSYLRQIYSLQEAYTHPDRRRPVLYIARALDDHVAFLIPKEEVPKETKKSL